jgi:hypothetical protein
VLSHPTGSRAPGDAACGVGQEGGHGFSNLRRFDPMRHVSLGIASRFCGVSIVIGKTALTRMRSLRTSSARLSVNRITALLVAPPNSMK